MQNNNVFYGKWITVEGTPQPNLLYDVYKDFFCPDKAENIFINISADDYYKLYINDRFVCQGPAPGYCLSYNYNRCDITSFVNVGQTNRIRVEVFYQGLINRVWVSGDGKTGLIADIYIGKDILLSTDESWVYVKNSSFKKGEIIGYDTAFSELRNFTAEPEKALRMAETDCIYTFNEKPSPLLQIYPLYPAKTEYYADRIFIDFEKERAGTLNFKASSDSDGKKIILHFSEELDDGGRVRFNLRCSCKYEDIYILKAGENLIEQFDYKAFRYCEILFDKGVHLTDIKMLVRHFPFPEKEPRLNSKNERLRAIFNLSRDTVKYGTQEVFVDCPTREKGQYFGDVTISGFSHLYLTKDSYMIKKAFRDFARSYEYCKEFLAVSPCSYKQKIADYTLQFAFNLYRYYLFTKDKAFLCQMLPVCDKINGYFSRFSRFDGLLEKVDEQWNLVDWPENCRDGYDFDLSDPIADGCHNVVNAFYLSSLIYTEKIKDILGITHEKESEKLKEAFNRTFFDSDSGLYKDSEVSSHHSLHGNCLPALFGIYDKKDDRLSDFLLSKRLSCGVYMAYFYLRSLYALGKGDEALEIMTSDDENSWSNMLREGATTCFEAWGKDKKWNTSLFHPWATAPVCILKEEYENMF